MTLKDSIATLQRLITRETDDKQRLRYVIELIAHEQVAAGEVLRFGLFWGPERVIYKRAYNDAKQKLNLEG